MRKILILTVLSLLVALGVVAKVLLTDPYDPTHSHKIIEREDFDAPTLSAYNYVKNEFVEPLQRFDQDIRNEKVFSRTYGSGHYGETKSRLFALQSDNKNENLFLTTKVDSDGRYLPPVWSLTFKIKFVRDTQQILLEDDAGLWTVPNKNRRFYPLFVDVMGDSAIRDYFSEDVLDGPKPKKPQQEEGLNRLAQF